MSTPSWPFDRVAPNCGECDGWHLYRAQRDDVGRVAAMRGSGVSLGAPLTARSVPPGFRDHPGHS